MKITIECTCGNKDSETLENSIDTLSLDQFKTSMTCNGIRVECECGKILYFSGVVE